MPFFICNILQGALITEVFQVCLVVSQTLAECTLLQIFCWYSREKLGSQFSLVACEDCLQICFMGTVVERNYVLCLVIIVIFMGFGQAETKRCGGYFKVMNQGWQCKTKKGACFHREGRFLQRNTAVMQIFIASLTGCLLQQI